jgi:hypothetical protein
MNEIHRKQIEIDFNKLKEDLKLHRDGIQEKLKEL